jgi:UMF1 family MFS transporter
MYDWANSAFMVTIITAIFPIYFQQVAAADLDPAVALAMFGWASTIAVLIVALISPVLGTIADSAGVKKKMLAVFLGIGVVATALMYFISRGEWVLAAVLFVVANVGAFGSMAFYDSLLPHIAGPDEIDRVSTAGYALGYLGGGLLLALNCAWVLKPEWFGLSGVAAASRLSFVSVAVWWLAFSIPIFRRVPEPVRRIEADEPAGGSSIGLAFVRLGETFRELRRFRQAFLLLVAFAIYNDGINTIIRMASSYGVQIGLQPSDMVPAFLLVQFVGVPFAFLFGMLASRIGAKPAIFVSLIVYAGISLLAYFISTPFHFYLLAILVATVQGGSQALSRSIFATMIPSHRSAQFFAFFAIFEKFTGVLGPAIFASTVAATGSSRIAILSIIAFFVVGGAILLFVRIDEGQRAAREAETALAPV